MKLSGAHAILYSRKAEADRAFFRDALGLPSVDVGGGWLIFGLPPAEVAVHPGDNDHHELYLMCDDIQEFTKEMTKRKVPCTPVMNRDWGLVCQVTLPGGGELGVYEPRHARPKVPARRKAPASRKKK